MTYLIDRGFLIRQLKDNYTMPFYELLKSRDIQLREMEDALNVLPKDIIRFRYLICQNGNSFYITEETNLMTLLTSLPSLPGNYINPRINIKERILEVLINYEQGFRRMWKEWNIQGKDEAYKSVGMHEMFKVIADRIEDRIRD